MAGVALAAGLPKAWLVKETAEFQTVLDQAYQSGVASLIALKIESEPVKRLPVTLDGVENRYRFIRQMEKAENVQILRPARQKLPSELKWD